MSVDSARSSSAGGDDSAGPRATAATPADDGAGHYGRGGDDRVERALSGVWTPYRPRAFPLHPKGWPISPGMGWRFAFILHVRGVFCDQVHLPAANLH